MKARVFYAYQWYDGFDARGTDDQRHAIAVVFAVDWDQARAAIPMDAIHPPGKGNGTWGEVQVDEIGQIETPDRLPILMDPEG